MPAPPIIIASPLNMPIVARVVISALTPILVITNALIAPRNPQQTKAKIIAIGYGIPICFIK